MGVIGSVVCRAAVSLTEQHEWDDAVDAWGVHGVGGFLGTIFTGLFADGRECADVKTAPEYCANPGTITFSRRQVILQTIAAVVAAVYSLVVTWIIIEGMSWFLQPRNNPEDPDLDEEEHGENAYVFTRKKGSMKRPAVASNSSTSTELWQSGPGSMRDLGASPARTR